MLHAVRDRLTVDESAQFAAQLPLLIRGVYYDGWNPTSVPIKARKEEFLDRVRREFPFDIGDDIEPVIHVVLNTLKRHVTEGEWDHIRTSMGRKLASVLT